MNKKLLIASLVTLASVAGVVGTVGNAERVGAYTNQDSKIYFVKPDSWTASTVNFMIGHDSYSKGYKMTQVGGTQLYYVNVSDAWEDSKYYAFFNTSGEWGEEYSSIDHRKNYADNYTGSMSSYDLNYNNFYLCTAASGEKGAALSITWKGTSISSMNLKVSVNETEGGSAFVTGSKLSANTTLQNNSGISVDIAISTDATLNATAKEGYEFVGWYEGEKEISTELIYVVRDVYESKTYTPKFNKIIADEPEEISSIFERYYNDGSYTKDSVLNVNSSTMSEVAKYFHASQVVRYRKTIYTPDGLKMTTSEDGSTYSNESVYTNGDNCVIHTGFNGNFTVNQPSVEDWFVTLKDFKDSTIEGWTYADGVYSHDLVETTATTEDTLTKMAREFVAPMWLAPNAENYNYVTFSKLTVEEVDDQLVMKLYVKEDNSGQLIEGSNLVFSQITISK